MARIVVVANAPLRWSPHLVSVVRGADLVLAADGGANSLARVGIRPAEVVGDLDSLRAGVRRWIGEERIVHRGDQDFTDLHKTIAHALDEHRATRVTILGAIGGRVDHTIENLALLARFAERAELDAWDEGTRIVPVVHHAVFATEPGRLVSLLPVGRCEGVSTSGLRWPLAGEPLDLLARTGVSNVATAAHVGVGVSDGCILVFLHEASPAP